MCLRRAPEKYIAGAALDRAALELVFGEWSQIENSPTLSTLQSTYGPLTEPTTAAQWGSYILFWNAMNEIR
jgi:hypothetical protein